MKTKPNKAAWRLGNRKEFPRLIDIRREAARIYWSTKQGEIDPQMSSRLVYVLQVIASIVKGEIEGDVEKLRAEVDQLKAEIAAGRDGSTLPPMRLISGPTPSQ